MGGRDMRTKVEEEFKLKIDEGNSSNTDNLI